MLRHPVPGRGAGSRSRRNPITPSLRPSVSPGKRDRWHVIAATVVVRHTAHSPGLIVLELHSHLKPGVHCMGAALYTRSCGYPKPLAALLRV